MNNIFKEGDRVVFSKNISRGVAVIGTGTVIRITDTAVTLSDMWFKQDHWRIKYLRRELRVNKDKAIKIKDLV